MEASQARRLGVTRYLLLLGYVLSGAARILQSETKNEDFEYFLLARWDGVSTAISCTRLLITLPN